LICSNAPFAAIAWKPCNATITQIVIVDLPNDLPRDAVIGLFWKPVPRWQGWPGLIRKHDLCDGTASVGGGVYLWETRAQAEAAHDTAWCDMAEALYGARPRFQYFETPIVVDNSG